MSSMTHSSVTRSPMDISAWPILIRMLGDFRLLQAGQPVSIRAGSKTEGLLAHLALQNGHRAPRERLIQWLWPNSDLDSGLHSLNTQVYAVNKLLRPALVAHMPIVHEDGHYRLNVECGIGVDVEWFDRYAKSGDELTRSGHPEQALNAYRSAIDLYQGDLCVSSGTHSIVERERLRARYLSLLSLVADHFFRVGELDICLDFIWRLLAHDPCREDAHRLAMRCFVRRGERAAAFHQYRVCTDMLRTDLGIEPEPATRALLDQIRMGAPGL